MYLWDTIFKGNNSDIVCYRNEETIKSSVHFGYTVRTRYWAVFLPHEELYRCTVDKINRRPLQSVRCNKTRSNKSRRQVGTEHFNLPCQSVHRQQLWSQCIVRNRMYWMHDSSWIVSMHYNCNNLGSSRQAHTQDNISTYLPTAVTHHSTAQHPPVADWKSTARRQQIIP